MVISLFFSPCVSRAEVWAEVCEPQVCGDRGHWLTQQEPQKPLMPGGLCQRGELTASLAGLWT